MVELSATARIREEMEVILEKKANEEGLTFNELWDKLEDNKGLKKLMYTKENKKRLGLLQGLSNRIKDGKIDNVKIIRRGKDNLFIFFSNELEYLYKLTESYLEDAKKIDLSGFTDCISSDEKKVLIKLDSLWNNLGDNNVNIKSINKKILKKKSNVK